MNKKRILLALLSAAVGVGELLILGEIHRPQPASTVTSTTEAEPQAAPDRSVPKAIQPVEPQQVPVAPSPIPPGTTVATPGGDPDQPIQPAPRGARIIRDHRGLNEIPPTRKVTPQGINAASAAIGPAVASCL